MSNSNNHRRIVLIRPAFQIRFIAMVVGLVLLASLLSGFGARYLLFGELTAGMNTAHLQIGEVAQRIDLAIIVAHVVGGVLAVLGAIFGVLYASHRIAGPLYRFSQLCGQIGKREFTTATDLREKDQLQGLADEFRSMMAALKKNQDSQRDALEKAKGILGKLQAEGVDRELSEASLKMLAESVDQLETLIDSPRGAP